MPGGAATASIARWWSLAFDQVADRQQWSGARRFHSSAQPCAIIVRVEENPGPPVAQHRHPIIGHTHFDQVVFQCAGNGHHVAAFGRPAGFCAAVPTAAE